MKIKWEWLIFLAALELLAIVFLIATIIRTNVTKVPILKSSSLASLCVLDEDCKDQIGGVKSRRRVWENALDLNISLRKGGGGEWKLQREELQ